MLAVNEDPEFEAQLKAIQPKFWHYRTVGRSIGFILFLGGMGGGFSSYAYLNKPAQVYGRALGITGKSNTNAELTHSFFNIWYYRAVVYVEDVLERSCSFAREARRFHEGQFSFSVQPIWLGASS
jgi:hypothetical protein